MIQTLIGSLGWSCMDSFMSFHARFNHHALMRWCTSQFLQVIASICFSIENILEAIDFLQPCHFATLSPKSWNRLYLAYVKLKHFTMTATHWLLTPIGCFPPFGAFQAWKPKGISCFSRLRALWWTKLKVETPIGSKWFGTWSCSVEIGDAGINFSCGIGAALCGLFSSMLHAAF